MTTINQYLHEHRRSLLEQERHAASLEVRHNTGQPAEAEIVNAQLERNMDAFTTDELGLCPGCGSSNTKLDIDQEDWSYNPRCLDCGKSGGWFNHRRAAIASWNSVTTNGHWVPCETGLDKDWKWLEEAAQEMGLAGLPVEFETPTDCRCEMCQEEAIAALVPFAKRQWFADYQNPNSDAQDLQERARDLGIDGRDWQEYHKRREAALDEAAKQF